MTQKIIRRPVQHSSSNLHPIIYRVLTARGISINDLDYSLKNLLPYNDLKNIDLAVQLLYETMVLGQRILIIADYDADGATSCALTIKALTAMGATNIDFLVPNREKHGYGLSAEIVALAYNEQPQLLVTVDNGIVSFLGVEAARRSGMKILITDHHVAAATLPDAHAIINPNQAEDKFASKYLAGVGVIFYVMLALRQFLRQQGWFAKLGLTEPNLAYLLDLVALGTVADMVPLDRNNRILVEQGLRCMRANKASIGIKALINNSGCVAEKLTTTDLGFRLAPRLNAAGRMDDMRYGILCLLCEDELAADQYAQNLNYFNEERRYVETEMQAEAEAKLAELTELTKQDLPLGLCLLEPHWHQGVIGLLANKIKEKFNRPVVVLTHALNDSLRGSARSVPGVHIKDVLERIAAQHPNLLTKFGGHAMAAGLTLPRANYAIFRHAFEQQIQNCITENDLDDKIYTDGELTSQDFNLELAQQLRYIVPWGQGCPEPLFDGIFNVLEYKILKQKHLKMLVSPATDNSIVLNAIYFNAIKSEQELAFFQPAIQSHLVYHLRVNEFQQQISLQLLITNMQAVT
jgi:single-stranded-DNA-specific exonuclease